MASQAQIEANQRNAKLSRGPTSAGGRLKSSMNALKHGRRSARLKQFQENSYRYEERRVKWMSISNPQNDIEEFMVSQTAAHATNLERVQRADAERTTTLIEKAEEAELEEAHDLGRCLFHDPSAPAAIYGVARPFNRELRPSWTKNPDDSYDPAKIVRKMLETASGVAWMLERWIELRERLEGPKGLLVPSDRFRATRLLGCQPMDAIHDRRVAEIFAAGHALYQAGDPYEEFSPDTGHNLEDYVKFLKAQHKNLVRKDQPEKAREILINLVDTQIEELEAKFQTFVENAESDGKRSVDRLCFDGASEGKEMHKFQLRYFGAYYRSVAACKKYQRQNGGRGPGGGGKDEVDALDAAAWREFLPARCRRPELKSQEAYDLEAQAGDIDWARTAETNTVEVATPECESLTLPGENGRNVTNDPNLDEGASITQQIDNVDVASDSDAVLGVDKLEAEETEEDSPDGAMGTAGEPEPPSPPAADALAQGTSEEDGPERHTEGGETALVSGSMNSSKSKSKSMSMSWSGSANNGTPAATMATCEDRTSATASGRDSEVGVVDESEMTGHECFEDSS